MTKYREILNQWRVPDGKSTDQAWLDMQAKMTQRKASAKVVAFSWKPLISVAAAAAIIVGLVLIWPQDDLKIFQCMAGRTEVVTLPDESKATLNAGSSLTFSEDWGNERSVELKGQAFFEVIKGSTFRVVTPGGVVEVLGTSFDVFSRESEFRVACRTGKVRVSAGKQSVEIAPGFTAILENNRLLVGEFELADPDWRNGEFIYRDAPLGQVFEELGRQFNVKMDIPAIVNRRYTGRFSNKNLEDALQLICTPMGLIYSIDNSNHVIVQEGQVVK
jgi:ferric-dicitrate binding protein FerR (iron transport regulator)